jgi:hypothetical protein
MNFILYRPPHIYDWAALLKNHALLGSNIKCFWGVGTSFERSKLLLHTRTSVLINSTRIHVIKNDDMHTCIINHTRTRVIRNDTRTHA